MSSIHEVDRYANDVDGFFQKASVYSKLSFFLLVLVSIVFSANLSFLILVLSVLAALSVPEGMPTGKLLKWALFPTFFALIFAVSQLGAGLTPLRTILRAYSAALSALFLIFATPYHEIFGITSKFSNFLATFMFLTYRYFFLLLETIETKTAMMKVRGGSKRRIRSLGKMVGFFVVDLLNRSERIYHLLKVRGFKGRLGKAPGFNFAGKDFLIIVVGLLLFLINLNFYG